MNEIYCPTIVVDNYDSETTQKITQYCLSKDIPVEVVKYQPFSEIQKVVTDLARRDVIFFGTINMANWCRKKTKWLGVWLDPKEFECSSYYCRFGEYLINSDYLFMPLSEFLRRNTEFFDYFGDEIFIRPNSGNKSFTGNILTRSRISYEIKSLSRVPLDDQMVILSSKKEIGQEYRLFVFDDKIVAGSQYHENGYLLTLPEVPPHIMAYAQDVVKVAIFGNYVLDIGVVGDKIGVVEINSVTCSGMYDCDVGAIVDAAIHSLTGVLEDY
jgi:hypothetical protein